MRKKINIVLGVTLVVLLGLTACETYEWEPPVWDYTLNENTERQRPLVYDQHIAPLFEKYSCDGCHNGVIPPDLREENSEAALSSGSFLDAADAEESIIVIQIVDPEHGGTWNTLDLFTLLDWIHFETQSK